MSTVEKFSLDVINVASPCSVSWESMDGDGQVRYCSQCELNVYNLSSLSREDAEQLVQEREGRLCVRFYRRADGTVLIRDCPVGLRSIRRRLARVVGGIAAMIGFLTCGILVAGDESLRKGRGTVDGPMTRFIEWIDPWRYEVQGGVCAPPAPIPPPAVPAPPTPNSTVPAQFE